MTKIEQEKDNIDFPSLLIRFQVNESLHRMMPIIDDEDAQKVIAAWDSMATRWKVPDGIPPHEERELWEWLWINMQINYDELALRAGVSRLTAERRFKMLIAARLVYPNGTISSNAYKLLANIVGKALAAKIPRGMKKPDEKSLIGKGAGK